MPWSGSSFSRTNGVNSGSDVWEQDKAEPVNILASRHDAHDSDLADGINACVKKDGANAAGVVTSTWLADGAVGATAKIADGIITEAKLDADAATRSTLLYTIEQTLNSDTDIRITMPKACKVTHLTVAAKNTTISSGSQIGTLHKNGSTTSQSVTLANGTYKNYATITAQSFAAGDDLRIENSGTATGPTTVFYYVWGHFTE